MLSRWNFPQDVAVFPCLDLSQASLWAGSFPRAPSSQSHSACSSCVPPDLPLSLWPGLMGLFLCSLHLSDLNAYTQLARPQTANPEYTHDRRLYKARPSHHENPAFLRMALPLITHRDLSTVTLGGLAIFPENEGKVPVCSILP